VKTECQLQRDVLNELEWEPRVDHAHIGVAVKHGVVTLSGRVPSYGEKYEAVKAAKRVYGVSGVADELEVKIPGASERTDSDIAEAAVCALKAHASVPDDQIQVTVRDAWVTLDGSVEGEHQRAAAEGCVRYLAGVTGVSNAITIKPRAAPADVKKKIDEALQRSAKTDGRRITVGVKGRNVILRGNVRSAAERTEAERAAWAARGVSSIDNQIKIRP
jgi:osmotically-inducible protein OsmY